MALLFLIAGVRLVKERASRPRLVFVDRPNERAVVVHGEIAGPGKFIVGASGVGAGASGAPGPSPPTSASMPVTAGTVPQPWPPYTVGPDSERHLDVRIAGSMNPELRSNLIGNDYVHVGVMNDPETGYGPAAESAAARIEFIGDDGQVLLDIEGRWAEAPQRLQTGHLGITHAAAQLTIEANGIVHELDVALKTPGDTHFYACNDRNSEAHDHRLERHRLDVSKCRVRITVSATNAPPIQHTFVLTNDASGLRLSSVDEADA